MHAILSGAEEVVRPRVSFILVRRRLLLGKVEFTPRVRTYVVGRQVQRLWTDLGRCVVSFSLSLFFSFGPFEPRTYTPLLAFQGSQDCSRICIDSVAVSRPCPLLGGGGGFDF